MSVGRGRAPLDLRSLEPSSPLSTASLPRPLGRGLESSSPPSSASLPRPFGRGRARFTSLRNDEEDATAMALLRRQLEIYSRMPDGPLTPDTPSASSSAVDGQFADSFDGNSSGASTPLRSASGYASGFQTPVRRPRCISEASSSTVSTPRSTSSYNFRGDEDPDCVCYREKKQVICRMCGDAYLGRVRRKCTVHNNVKMLMDNDLCANCGIPCLFEYDHDGARD